MNASDDPIAEYLNQAALLLDLPIRAEHHDEVLAAFRILRAQSRLITEFELPAHFEPAPRFTP